MELPANAWHIRCSTNTLVEVFTVRRSLFFLLGILVMGVTLAAQTHDNMKEKKVSDTVTFSTDVRVGTTVLAPGEYRISCDRETIAFMRLKDRKNVAEVKCTGQELTRKSDETVVNTALDSNGVRYLKTLLLRGSTIEHTF
jgi:hypothetical protein